jgi:prepilin-type N-terminal cleavage/methylation domain-containing protein
VIKRQRGFTIVELLVAMAIFSFMSVILSAGITRLFQIYQAGTSIRASQQSAATISAKITRDVQAAQVVAVSNSYPMAGAYSSNFSAVCILNPVSTTTANQTLDGSIYFVYSSSGSYSPNDQIGVYEETGLQIKNVPVSAVTGLPTQGQLNNACTNAIPASTAGSTLLSTSDTSAIIFNAGFVTNNGVTLVQVLLSMAANADLANIDPTRTTSTTGGYCIDGTQARYCSVTNLNIASEIRGGAD